MIIYKLAEVISYKSVAILLAHSLLLILSAERCIVELIWFNRLL